MLGSRCSGRVSRGRDRALRLRPLRTPTDRAADQALGVSFFLQSSALLLFGADFRSYQTYEFIDLSTGSAGSAEHLGRPDR
jgi:hypothetical protein